MRIDFLFLTFSFSAQWEPKQFNIIYHHNKWRAASVESTDDTPTALFIKMNDSAFF